MKIEQRAYVATRAESLSATHPSLSFLIECTCRLKFEVAGVGMWRVERTKKKI